VNWQNAKTQPALVASFPQRQAKTQLNGAAAAIAECNVGAYRKS
jgi:hypothetical protein